MNYFIRLAVFLVGSDASMKPEDALIMSRALELAAGGEGFVEPNPMVGAVVVRDGEVIGEGFHRRFGGPHAEIEALQVAGARARGATLYVTLEPCCHHGKTPPCTDAIVAAGVARVVCAQRDPFPRVNGGGIAALEAVGIAVEVGAMAEAAQHLNAPYLKLVGAGKPWVIAKWAMSLDGKIATASGDSKWISGEASRAIVHQLRGRMDAIVVGRRTVELDDPLLTARPAGSRIATRIVVDSRASLSTSSRLIQTARETPVIVVATHSAPAENIARLRSARCEVLSIDPKDQALATDLNKYPDIDRLLGELGRRRMTNVLVEGGGELLGSFFDAHAVDEVHIFIAPKIIGGVVAPSPVGGVGVETIATSMRLIDPQIHHSGDDLYVQSRIRRDSSAP
jgi:diaminohydroxyphosphoribosylaminopyrimidine deaminase/5-amino-6-(5-phosphoribosylamino)uracil reductase